MFLVSWDPSPHSSLPLFFPFSFYSSFPIPSPNEWNYLGIVQENICGSISSSHSFSGSRTYTRMEWRRKRHVSLSFINCRSNIDFNYRTKSIWRNDNERISVLFLFTFSQPSLNKSVNEMMAGQETRQGSIWPPLFLPVLSSPIHLEWIGIEESDRE